MPCQRAGHEHDTDQPNECPVCREIVHDTEHHTCARPQGATP